MKILSENNKTAINLISSIIAMAVSIIINFFLSPFIVTHLGEEANGFTQLANNFIMYASLVTIALNSMAGRFIAIEHHQKNIQNTNTYYSSVIIGNIAIILLFIIPSIYVLYNLQNLLKISSEITHDTKLLFTFVIINFFVNQIISVVNISFFVTNSLYIFNIINMAKAIINGICLLVVFNILPPQIYYVSLIGLVLTLATLPLFLSIKKRLLPFVNFSLKKFDIKYLRVLIASGVWNTINQCGNILMTGVDLLVANLFINPVQMGVLATAKIIPNTIIQVATTINTSFSPNLTITYAKGDKKALLKSLRTCMKTSSILLSLSIIVFSVFSNEFYSLWMPTLDASTLTLVSFLTIMAFIPLAGPQVLYNVFTATNKLKWNSITFVLCGVLNFILVIFFFDLSSYGIYIIAGLSSAITILRNLLFVVPYTAHLLGLKWYAFFKDVGISLACCTITGTVSFAVKLIISINTWFTLFIAIGLSIIICAAIFFVSILNKEEKKTLMTTVFKKEVIYG